MKTILAYLIAAPILAATVFLIALTIGLCFPVYWAFNFLTEGDGR